MGSTAESAVASDNAVTKSESIAREENADIQPPVTASNMSNAQASQGATLSYSSKTIATVNTTQGNSSPDNCSQGHDTADDHGTPPGGYPDELPAVCFPPPGESFK